jgi:multimeric flavodoxin WrbA
VRTLVVYYSRTGNNKLLAERAAEALKADLAAVEEAKPRTMPAIILDMALKRVPAVRTPAVEASRYDALVVVGPVWMGMVASPLRAFLANNAPSFKRYFFLSISGGAEGPNPGLGAELAGRVGFEPAAVVDMHIADLMPPDPKPTKEMTSSYRVTSADLNGALDAGIRELAAAVSR